MFFIVCKWLNLNAFFRRKHGSSSKHSTIWVFVLQGDDKITFKEKMKKTYFKKFLSYDGDRWSNYVLQKLQGCKSYVISGITLLMQLGLHEIQGGKDSKYPKLQILLILLIFRRSWRGPSPRGRRTRAPGTTPRPPRSPSTCGRGMKF